MTRQEILEQYEVSADGVIRSPGKFEGEMLYAPYYYDHGQGDETWDSGASEDAFAEVFRVTSEDQREFPELGRTILVAVEEDNQGFVHLTEWSNQREARKAQRHYERGENPRSKRRKNPGTRWHGRQAAEAEEDRIKAEDRGSIIGSHFYRGKREAHRESQAESRRMGLNPWETYAGGTTALPGKYSYVLDFPHGRYDIEPPTPSARSYRLYFLNTKGAKGGGLYQLIGDFRSPQAAKGAAKKHAQQWFSFKLNPGATWHQEQEQLAEAMERRETRPRRKTYLRGMADAHALSAHESRKMGLNPEYQGWTNWETWNLNLWAMNEEPAYRYIMAERPFTPAKAREVAADLFPRGTPDMQSRGRSRRDVFEKVNWQEIAESWNEGYEGNPRPSAIPAHKLAAANRYVNLIRNKQKRDYGFAYLAWLKGGAVGHEPERPAGLSVMGAQAVRLQLDAMKLWENPRGARTLVGRVFKAERWAKRWARGRPIRKVKGGWQILAGRTRTPAQERAHRRNPEIGMTFNTKAKAKRYAAAMQKLGHSVSLVPQQYGTWRVILHEKNPRKVLTWKDKGAATISGRLYKLERNPIAVYNPPEGKIIYGRVLAVEAQKTNGTYRGKRFRHSFEKDSRVVAYALADGSVLLKSAAGKRLWQDR